MHTHSQYSRSREYAIQPFISSNRNILAIFLFNSTILLDFCFCYWYLANNILSIIKNILDLIIRIFLFLLIPLENIHWKCFSWLKNNSQERFLELPNKIWIILVDLCIIWRCVTLPKSRRSHHFLLPRRWSIDHMIIRTTDPKKPWLILLIILKVCILTWKFSVQQHQLCIL